MHYLNLGEKHILTMNKEPHTPILAEAGTISTDYIKLSRVWSIPQPTAGTAWGNSWLCTGSFTPTGDSVINLNIQRASVSLCAYQQELPRKPLSPAAGRALADIGCFVVKWLADPLIDKLP